MKLRFLLAFLIFLFSVQMVAQPSEGKRLYDSMEQTRLLKSLRYTVQQQQSNVKNLSSNFQDVKQQNDSLKNEIATYKNAINDSLSNYKVAINEELNEQQSNVDTNLYELRKRFFIVAGFVLILALLLLVVYLVLYRKYKAGYAALEERYTKLEEKYDQLSKQIVENDQKHQKELNTKLDEHDRKMRRDVDRKIEENNEVLAKDIRIVHGPALKMAQEVQELRNRIDEDMERQKVRKIEKEASAMERELRHQGYRMKDYTDKKVKEGMPLDIRNMTEDEAIGKEIDITLKPELKFNKKIIQKASVRVEEEKETDGESESEG